MAFIDITEPKSPINVAVVLGKCKSGEIPLTPEVCHEVLRSTNFAKNIRDMLMLISALPADEQKAFEYVVLATFDRREQPEEVWALGRDLAVNGGYDWALNRLAQSGGKYGDYLFSASCKRGFAIERFEKDRDYSKYDEVLLLDKNVYLDKVDLSDIKKLRFIDGADVKLYSVDCMPAEIDVSNCEMVDLSGCELSSLKTLKFKDGASVRFFAQKLPADLDVSMCARVSAISCDLSEIKELKFREGADVSLEGSINLLEEVDFSMCDRVWLKDIRFSTVRELRFKNSRQRENSQTYISKGVKVVYAEEEDDVNFVLRGRGGRS